jgi:hypothetical protein
MNLPTASLPRRKAGSWVSNPTANEVFHPSEPEFATLPEKQKKAAEKRRKALEAAQGDIFA